MVASSSSGSFNPGSRRWPMIASRSVRWITRQELEARVSPLAAIAARPVTAARARNGCVPSGATALGAGSRRRACERPGIGLRTGPLIPTPTGGPQTERHQAFGELHGRSHARTHGHTVLLGEGAGEVRHAGTAEHDRLGAILDERPGDLLRDALAGVGGRSPRARA